jgi:hypothetical protein
MMNAAGKAKSAQTDRFFRASATEAKQSAAKDAAGHQRKTLVTGIANKAKILARRLNGTAIWRSRAEEGWRRMVRERPNP